MEMQPLTHDEEGMLRHIHKKRLGLFLKVWLFLYLLAAYVIYIMWGRYSYRYIGDVLLLNIIWIMSIITVAGIVVYRKRVLKIKRDMNRGLKKVVYEPIIQVSGFEQTGQYFLGFDNPDYPYHQLEYNEWVKWKVGDLFPLYKAPLSGYVFNGQGKFSII